MIVFETKTNARKVIRKNKFTHKRKTLELQSTRMQNLAHNAINVNSINTLSKNTIERLNVSIVNKITCLKVINALYVSKNNYMLI